MNPRLQQIEQALVAEAVSTEKGEQVVPVKTALQIVGAALGQQQAEMSLSKRLGKLRSTMRAMVRTYDDHELRDRAREAMDEDDALATAEPQQQPRIDWAPVPHPDAAKTIAALNRQVERMQETLHSIYLQADAASQLAGEQHMKTTLGAIADAAVAPVDMSLPAKAMPPSLRRRAQAALDQFANEKGDAALLKLASRLEAIVREMLEAAPPAPTLPEGHVAVRREWLPVMNEIRRRGNADFDPSMADGFEVHLSTEQWGPVLDAELGLNAAPNQSPDQGPTP